MSDNYLPKGLKVVERGVRVKTTHIHSFKYYVPWWREYVYAFESYRLVPYSWEDGECNFVIRSDIEKSAGGNYIYSPVRLSVYTGKEHIRLRTHSITYVSDVPGNIVGVFHREGWKHAEEYYHNNIMDIERFVLAGGGE